MEAESVPPAPRGRCQRGHHDGATGVFLVELDRGCQDVRAERGRDTKVRVMAVHGQAAEEQRWNGIRCLLCQLQRSRGAVDRRHCNARVRHHDAISIGDHPGRRGVPAAALAGMASKPFIEHRLAAVESAAIITLQIEQPRTAKLSQATRTCAYDEAPAPGGRSLRPAALELQ